MTMAVCSPTMVVVRAALVNYKVNKMKNMLIASILLLTLTGCFYQRVSGYEIRLAQKACEEYGGVRAINSWGTGSVRVYCNYKVKDPIGSSSISFTIDKIEKNLLNKQ